MFKQKKDIAEMKQSACNASCLIQSFPTKFDSIRHPEKACRMSWSPSHLKTRKESRSTPKVLLFSLICFRESFQNFPLYLSLLFIFYFYFMSDSKISTLIKICLSILMCILISTLKDIPYLLQVQNYITLFNNVEFM